MRQLLKKSSILTAMIILLLFLIPYSGNALSYTPAETYNWETLDDAVNGVISQMNNEGITGQYEQALWLNDWLMNNATYDYSYSIYEAEGVLLYGTGVCESYARAYQLLLEAVGIESMLIPSDEMNHVWNLVKINGQWVHVDVTWNDPGEGGGEHHYYFGMNDQLMGRNHTWVKGSFPTSTTLDYYYLLRNGYTAVSSVEDMGTKLAGFASEKTETFNFVYTGPDPDFSMTEVLMDWLENFDWKYGVNNYGYYGEGDDYAARNAMTFQFIYSEPWAQPASVLPKAAQNFTMTGPDGSYSLSDFSQKGVVLIFGRTICGNTRNLLYRLEEHIDLVNALGIEVLANMIDSTSAADLTEIQSSFPEYTYTYNQASLMWSYLYGCGFKANYLTFPAVFVIDPNGQIVHYSTDYVSNVDKLLSKIYGTKDFVINGRTLVSYTGNAQSIKIPEGITAIGSSAFSGSANLKQIEIPETVVSIDNNAFSGCDGLKTITLPKSVEMIGSNAFSDPDMLFYVYYKSYAAEWAAHNERKYVYLDAPDVIPPESIKLFNEAGEDVTGTSIIISGDSFTLSASALPKDAVQSFKWESSDVSAAVVDGLGSVTFLKEGSVRITVSSMEFPEITAYVDLGYYKPGNINGDDEIDLFDLIRLRRYIVDSDNVEVFAQPDTNGDGEVNLFDLIRLRRYIVDNSVEIY